MRQFLELDQLKYIMSKKPGVGKTVLKKAHKEMKLFLPDMILSDLGCYNEMPQTGSFINNRHPYFYRSEAVKSMIKALPDLVPGRVSVQGRWHLLLHLHLAKMERQRSGLPSSLRTTVVAYSASKGLDTSCSLLRNSFETWTLEEIWNIQSIIAISLKTSKI